MKKFMLTIALIMTIATTLVAGTLAVYNVNADLDKTGSVVSKTFTYKLNAETDYWTSVKIAPEETVEKYFSTRANFEVDANASFVVTMSNDAVREFNPLVKAQIYKETADNKWEPVSDVFGGINGCKSGTIKESFTKSQSEQVTNYKVVFTWPSTDNDVAYQGSHFGNVISINGSATQVTEDNSSVPVVFSDLKDTGLFAISIQNLSGKDDYPQIFADVASSNLTYGLSQGNLFLKLKKTNSIKIQYNNGKIFINDCDVLNGDKVLLNGDSKGKYLSVKVVNTTNQHPIKINSITYNGENLLNTPIEATSNLTDILMKKIDLSENDSCSILINYSVQNNSNYTKDNTRIEVKVADAQ